MARGDGAGDGSGKEGADCVVPSRVSCLVSFCLFGREKKKKRRWRVTRQLPRESTDVEKRLAKTGV